MPVLSPHVAAIVSGVLAGLIVCLGVVVMALLYRRGLAIRRKRALRRYLESGEVMITDHFITKSIMGIFIPIRNEKESSDPLNIQKTSDRRHTQC